MQIEFLKKSNLLRKSKTYKLVAEFYKKNKFFPISSPIFFYKPKRGRIFEETKLVAKSKFLTEFFKKTSFSELVAKFLQQKNCDYQVFQDSAVSGSKSENLKSKIQRNEIFEKRRIQKIRNSKIRNLKEIQKFSHQKK